MFMRIKIIVNRSNERYYQNLFRIQENEDQMIAWENIELLFVMLTWLDFDLYHFEEQCHLMALISLANKKPL